MNKVKEAYKEVIVRFIIENYLELKQKVDASQGAMSEHELNQRFAALKFMKNLVKTITAESDAEIQERIEEVKNNELQHDSEQYEE